MTLAVMNGTGGCPQEQTTEDDDHQPKQPRSTGSGAADVRAKVGVERHGSSGWPRLLTFEERARPLEISRAPGRHRDPAQHTEMWRTGVWGAGNWPHLADPPGRGEGWSILGGGDQSGTPESRPAELLSLSGPSVGQGPTRPGTGRTSPPHRRGWATPSPAVPDEEQPDPGLAAAGRTRIPERDGKSRHRARRDGPQLPRSRATCKRPRHCVRPRSRELPESLWMRALAAHRPSYGPRRSPRSRRA